MKHFGTSTARQRISTTLRTRDALRVTRVFGGVLVPALRVGLSYLLPIAALATTGHLDLAPFAALGAFTSLYCRVDPYARRARLLLVVGVGLTASTAAGAATAASDAGGVAKVVVLTLVATAAKLVADVLELGPPGGLMFVFAAGAAAYSPQTWTGFSQVVAVTAASAGLSYLLSMSGAVLHPTGPHRLATARALLATADQLESPSTDRRHRAHTALHRALSEVHGHTQETAEELRAQLAHAAHLLHRPSGRSAGVSAEISAQLRALARRCRRGGVPAADHALPAPHPLPRRRRGPLAALAPYRSNAARMALASLITGLALAAFQLEHAYWAVVSVSSVLQSQNATTTWHRAVQRCAGTAAGSVLALLIFAAHPSPWAMLVVIVVCQVAAELVVMSNYGLGLTFATPLALCLAALSHPDHLGLVVERVTMTLVGAVIGVAVCAVLLNRRSAQRLREAVRSCQRATEELRSAPADAEARGRLLAAVFALRDAHHVVSGEFQRHPDPRLVLDTEHRAYQVLADTAPSAAAQGSRA
ncbi:FUSC family protein [Saccharopolyspora griseoalba]|uniref:FUSC family protein n=1 Tax=Saccharopolyspora griseoalba TaxID=1431848 RepID=A0ABW2LEQ7_9PSEU